VNDLARVDVHLEELNGVELYLEDTGPKDAPALMYLHGGPGYNSYSFQDIVGESLEQYRVVYPDQRGCGRSGQLPDNDLRFYTIDALVDDLEAVREHLGLARFTPLGHGFGAVIALEYARRFARRVENVVVVNPWVHFPELSRTLLEEAARLSGMSLKDVPSDSETRIERAFALLNSRDLLTALHFPNPQGRLRLEFSDAESTLMAGGNVQEGLVLNGLWDLEYPLYFSEIIRPIGVIAGTLDRTSYPGQTDWVVDLTPNAELAEIEDAGHYPWVDDLDSFVAALEHFVPKGAIH
jgi:proline iminopeptidase